MKQTDPRFQRNKFSLINRQRLENIIVTNMYQQYMQINANYPIMLYLHLICVQSE
jgi:hypothetical protein